MSISAIANYGVGNLDNTKHHKTEFTGLLDTIYKLIAERDGLQDENNILRNQISHSAHEYNYSNAHQAATDPFVLVLIDGDLCLFNDAFVQKGVQGGQDAALQLRESITTQLRADHRFEDHFTIVVRVYANMDGLAKTYCTTGILPHSALYREFVKGFNRTIRLYDYVDAGDDKEASDRKLQAHFKLNWSNAQCRSIVLAGSGDRGYTGFLREYIHTKEDRDRLVLLEAQPHTRDMSSIAKGVLNIKDDLLFRDRGFDEVATTSPSHIHAVSQASPPVKTYASVATWSQEMPPAGGNIPSVVGQATETMQSRCDLDSAPVMCYNNAGHRIDPPLTYNKTIMADLMSPPDGKRYCNNYHLGQCDHDPCPYKHGKRLTGVARDTLLWLARQIPCNYPECTRRDCYLGHRCPYDGHCTRMPCKFGPEMHNVDIVVAYED